MNNQKQKIIRWTQKNLHTELRNTIIPNSHRGSFIAINCVMFGKNCIASLKEKSLSGSLAAWTVKKGKLCYLGFCLPSLCDSSRLEISRVQFLGNSTYLKESFVRLIQGEFKGFENFLKLIQQNAINKKSIS